MIFHVAHDSHITEFRNNHHHPHQIANKKPLPDFFFVFPHLM